MGIIAMKFGGSSLADAAGFRRVRRIVERQRGRVYVVLSAPGKRGPGDSKVTDLLRRAHLGDRAALEEARSRFAEIARALGLRPPAAWLGALDECASRSADWAVSRGEWLCARLFAEFCGLPFVDASRLIFFDSAGRLLREPTRRAIRAMGARTPRAVIPGFYGALPDGEARALPRGGSDISGALVAAALRADRYENWTDVDGLLSADPALCPAAIRHDAVSYRQMRRLAQAGARVLHPDCLAPVQEAGVPTLLKNTFSPGGAGTYISDAVRGEAACVCVLEGLRAAAPNLEGAAVEASGAGRCSEGSAIEALGAEAGSDEAAVKMFSAEASFEETAVETLGTEFSSEEAAVEAFGAEASLEKAAIEAFAAEAKSEEAAVEAFSAKAESEEATVEAFGAEAGLEEAAVEAFGLDAGSEKAAVEALGAKLSLEEAAAEAFSAEPDEAAVAPAKTSCPAKARGVPSPRAALPNELRASAPPETPRFATPAGRTAAGIGQPASLVSAFGLRASDFDAARAELCPLAARLDDGCARFLVPAGRARQAVAALHARVISQTAVPAPQSPAIHDERMD